MDFTQNYKKKGLSLNNKEKRILRVQRRSIDQRLKRDQTYMKQRDIGSLTPLKEYTEENVKKAVKSTAVAEAPVRKETAETLARRAQLQKWKKEKELKKKLAAEEKKKKPTFKVYRVEQDKRPTNQSQLTRPQRRVTRASSKTVDSKAVNSFANPIAPTSLPERRTNRQSTRLASKRQDQKENLPVVASGTSKPVTSNKKTSASVSKPKPSQEEAAEVKFPAPCASQHVTSERGASCPTTQLQQSFAPSQFAFSFHFEPMSPASTQRFLYPKSAVRKGRCSTPMSIRRKGRGVSPQGLEISLIQSPKRPMYQAPQPEERSQEAKPNSQEDVSYFRNLVTTETTRLRDLCSKWEAVSGGSGLSEDVSGEIRCTIGKAQLLIAQRFKQFSGLVDSCEFGLGEKKTHCSDLTGFWDMIYYQVEDVKGMFASLDKLQGNNWVREEKPQALNPKPKKIVKKSKPVAKSQSSKDREAARVRLAAIKAALKTRQTRAKASEQTVFEGGFFKVESPVRSAATHCAAGSPFKTPSHVNCSNTCSPRIQGYTPKNAKRSIQGRLCGPLSKLVLGEVVTPISQTNAKKSATPIKPASQMEKMDKNPFAKYLQSSVINLNEQAEDMLQTEPQQQLVDLGVRSHLLNSSQLIENDDTCVQMTPLDAANKRCTRSHSENELLLPGLSPQIVQLHIPSSKICRSDIFTPPSLTPALSPPSTSQAVDDLICFDSPVPVNSVTAPTVMTPVRRSTRLRHDSAFSSLTSSLNNAKKQEMYSPNLSDM